jgi:hypothetical protein
LRDASGVVNDRKYTDLSGMGDVIQFTLSQFIK